MACAIAASATPPTYVVHDLGVVQAGDTASQGFRVSNGGLATGRSFRMGATQAFSWSVGAGIVGLPNLTSPSRAYGVGNGINDGGIVVGTGTTTSFGSSPLPLMWTNGVVSQLPLPAGQTLGRANDVNATGLVVGSVNGGSSELAVIYSGGTAQIITATGPNGSFMRTAFGVNDAGLVVGNGIDPTNAAVNVGMVYDSVSGQMTTVGSLPSMNGALAFDVSNTGHVVGGSMLNQGSSTPFIWTASGGIVAVPLPAGTSQGSARGVNSSGWVVGTASSAFAIPFLYDGTQTYRIGDLVDPLSGWDFLTNTSSSALGISEGGIIVGTAVKNGQVRGYALVPVPASTQVSGVLTLSGYVGPRALPHASFELVPTGGGTTVTVSGVTLGSGGAYSFATTASGTYDLYAKASTFLRRKRAGTITLAGSPVSGVDLTLLNGSVDRDNKVDLDDFLILAAAYETAPGDPGYLEDADLNGDESVSLDDFLILAANYEVNGD